MKKRSHIDANISLSLILLVNDFTSDNEHRIYREYDFVGRRDLWRFSHEQTTAQVYFTECLLKISGLCTKFHGGLHILAIFVFANYLPYSKHFHVFMSVPNVFLSRLEPLGKLTNMDNITREVKLMLNPETAFTAAPADTPVERFGVRDAEDATWKNYFDSLSCTECGRCTSVCPANITGKKLSPRKVMMDLRARMKEKGPLMIKNGRDFNDNRSLLRRLYFRRRTLGMHYMQCLCKRVSHKYQSPIPDSRYEAIPGARRRLWPRVN